MRIYERRGEISHIEKFGIVGKNSNGKLFPKSPPPTNCFRAVGGFKPKTNARA